MQVAISGAGPVGLTLACKLALHGVDVVCFEQSDGLCSFPRAVGVDDEVLRTLVDLGIGMHDLAPCLMTCVGMKYYGERGQTIGLIHPKRTPYGYFKGDTFYQPYLEELLLARARALGVRVEFSAKLVGFTQYESSVVLQVQRGTEVERHEAAYLVGCDGARSFVRKQLGIPFEGDTFKQRWLIVDTENDVRPERFVESWCHVERPTVTIPRRKGYRRWEFMLHPHESEADFRSLDSIAPLLAKHVATEEVRIARHHVYTFHSRLAQRYREGRVLLAGDAAHLMPPFMGQGMAAGIRDAENLGWKLAAAALGKLPPAVLDSYQQERRPHVHAMSKLAARAGRFVMPQSRLLSRLRDLVLWLLCLLPGIALAIEEALMRPIPKFVRGLFRVGTAHAGEMFPQPTMRNEDGRELLLDEALGTGFALVCYGSLEAPLSPKTRALLDRLDCRYVQIAPQGLLIDERFERLPGALVLDDQHHAIGAFTGSMETRLFLLRPDKYVMCSFVEREYQLVESWLEQQLEARSSALPVPRAVAAAA